jgi:putative ABC transport system substrate-binding protein
MRILVRMGLLLLWSLSVAAAPEATTVLVLGWFPEKSFAAFRVPLSRHLLGAGLKEGPDYRFEYHQVRSQEETDRVLKGRDPSSLVVFTANTSPGHFVRANGIRAPHVFQTFSDPVADGWIESYARPGTGRTGVTESVPVHGRRLDFLADLLPGATRIGVVFGPESADESVWDAIRDYQAAHPSKSFVRFRVARGESAETIGARLRRERIQALYVPLVGEIDAISEALFAAVRGARLPAITERHQDMKLGAVMAFQVERDVLPRLAHQLALVLRKTSPNDIPVLTPRRHVLSLNLPVAARLGLSIPRNLLRQAEVIVTHAD